MRQKTERSLVSIVHNDTTADAARIEEMLNESINLLGGIGKFVKEGDTVVIKGNFFSPAPPPVTIDRRLVRALFRILKTAKPKSITLVEAVSVGTKLGRMRTTNWIVEEIGIMDVVREEGVNFQNLEDVERVNVPAPGGRCLQHIDYPKIMLDADVVIDLPCMKTHCQTYVTLGIKNYQGILTDEQKYHSHREDLSQKLVDIFRVRLPDLTIVDGLLAMEGDGSDETGLPVPFNTIVASPDVVAADAVSCACMGMKDVLDVTTTRLAQFYGMGNANLDKIDVVGASIESVATHDWIWPTPYSKPYDRYAIGVQDNMDVYIGGACRECWHRLRSVNSMLSKYTDRKWTVLLGCDPKFPPMSEFDNDLENVIIFGDCACGCGGNVMDLRNAMLLAGKGLIAPGCPPFRPAMKMLGEYLVKLGLQEPGDGKPKFSSAQKAAYAYYQKLDPTWVPKSQLDGSFK
jgi:uncharacterized protein (DUF362 family)